MKPLKPRFPILLLLAGMGLASTAEAELLDRAFAVYDTVSHLSWLKDANYAQTSGYVADGRMDWNNANGWATGLTVGGFTGWRLPTTLQLDATCSGSFDAGSPYGVQSGGFSCTGSELGNLFYNGLGGTAGQSIANPPLTGPVLSTRPILVTRGASVPTMAPSTTTIRTITTMRGPCALAMSPPCQSRA